MSRSEQTWKVAAIEIADETKGSAKESLFKRILRKVFPDQRTETRCPAPPLVGYLGTAQGSRPFEVADVSLGGFSLLTEERWAAGTEMPITLRRSNVQANQPEDVFTVQATVVRWTEEGVAFSIVLFEDESNAVSDNPLQVRWVSRPEMKLFLERLKNPEEMTTQRADRRPANVEDPSLQAAFNSHLHMSPHTAGD